MKLKILQTELEFDREDATIFVPLILLLLGFATPLPKIWLLASFASYFLLLLGGQGLAAVLKRWIARRRSRCPYCGSAHTVLLGLQAYLGDCPYEFYRCNDCGEESVDVSGALVRPVPNRPRLESREQKQILKKYFL